MADGSREDGADPILMKKITFSAPDTGHGDSKKCSDKTFEGDKKKLSFYTELKTCEKSDSGGVAADDSAAVGSETAEKSTKVIEENGDDRKKRCFDRYDSSESSDSGVAVLSPSESGSGGSDITEPASPRSPESCGAEETAGARMPPWVSEPAPGPRRLPAQAPVRRSNQAQRTAEHHRRITEFFSHKMKPQNGLKRDSSTLNNEDAKKKCLPKNGVTHDLEKYISYLSYTLSPKVLLDVSKQNAAEAQKPLNGINGVIDTTKKSGPPKTTNPGGNGLIDYSKPKDNDKVHTTMNGFMEVRHGPESSTKEKSNGHLNGFVDGKKQNFDPSANGVANYKKQNADLTKRKVPIPASNELVGLRVSSTTMKHRKLLNLKPDTAKMNGVVSSTTKLDSRMNGVTCGSNNLSLNPVTTSPTTKKEAQRKTAQPAKRTNRKSSACIANSKNLTWSKANNLKQQVQLQKQNNCVNSVPSSSVVPEETNSTPKINVPNGVRQVPMTMNGNMGNLNVPVTNFQNCHQINIPQQCNGTVTSTNLGPFVAVPQNVMLTALRIPHNGLPAQTLTNHQPNNMNPYNRTNVNVQSPTKFVFPIMQNLNGAVVQIPNLMAKMPNFVLPQTPQLTTQRHDPLQNQQAQILINGTLLKLGNTMTPPYANVNKPTMPSTSQSGVSVLNKNLTGMPTMGVTVQPKPNYAVNLSHSVLVPQPGFIVTSVPNMNVKETWSYASTNPAPSPQTSCSNTIVHQPPPMVANFTTPTLHSRSIPIAPVKPPDNPIQGTDPPSSTVKEPEQSEVLIPKCDFPWLSKTFNNNIVPLDSNKKTLRPFAEVSSLTSKVDDYCSEKTNDDQLDRDEAEKWKDSSMTDLRKVEEVAKRENTIFTQITVLKDVSSNIQSTVIESNFCSTTTESSESGIGTGSDKSIDSPSDSQTSKECDDDSSLSLSISISSVEAQSSQKSPILKQPKTLRFPPRKPIKASNDKRTSSTDTSGSVTVCLWENCKQEFESDTDLLEHLQSIHVEPQAGKENYVCQWERCKVRGKPSCSRLWLERHAMSHGGNKPFKCIVDGCGRRFSTQILLERHVNNHFNEVSPGAGGGKKAADSAPKLIRRNGKKLRYRRQPWSARMFDFFDSGVMERLAWQLARTVRWRLGGACPLREPAGRHTLALLARAVATRRAAGRSEALVTYYPPHVLEDEWVPEKEVRRIKRVEIAALPAHTKVQLYEQYCASYRRPAAPPPPPTRTCASSRLLSDLLRKKDDCGALDAPLHLPAEPARAAPGGAAKRKQGRKYGGNAFWPCGR
ncbi:zinc finger protein jing homolog [Leguminivora glycinivorella]|uniref:zinc finger protein jing homolog n=1 Tax=Leguminivora glycinivorella TaxID=1035111 RepID=UPI0020108D94|nr:zinc finger protein jing homolog [Leguminivora glycinivorella]